MATTSDLILERLTDWGVDTIFGLPGDGINGFMEALRKREGEVRFVHVRHEETAALAAVGYAKFTGRLGVCLSTAGPGAIHLLNGLYDAAVDQARSLPSSSASAIHASGRTPRRSRATQALDLAEALARGEPSRQRIALTIGRDMIDERTFAASPYGVTERLKERAKDLLPGSREPGGARE